MAREKPAVRSPPQSSSSDHELRQALAELRNANQRLVFTGLQLHELAKAARESRNAAEAANRAKDEFLTALSHELRTPLNAILGWTQLLRSGGLSRDAADHALEIVERNARLQMQLISDLLDVSQIVTGHLRLNVETVDLAVLLTAAIESVRPAVLAKEISLSCTIGSRVDRVLADPARVEQIIWNLLSNAIKFTPCNGRIDVALRKAGSSVELSVTDSGIGIPADFLPQVFDRFRQGDGTSEPAFGGLGLGLAIVRQLMELHGGTVNAESAGVGRGASFTLSFPGHDGPPGDERSAAYRRRAQGVSAFTGVDPSDRDAAARPR